MNFKISTREAELQTAKKLGLDLSVVNDRIRFIIETHYSGNVSKLCRESDIRQSTMKDIVSGKRNMPSYETITKILSNKDINIDAYWLLFGTGNKNGERDEIDYDAQIAELREEIAFQKDVIKSLNKSIQEK